MTLPSPAAPSRGAPLVAHVTTTDISLSLLLGPQLRAFGEAGYDVVGISAPGPFVAELEAMGIRHVALEHATRAFSLKSDALAGAELFRLFRRLKPDVVHTHNPKPGVYGRMAARAARVPVVINTVHGLYATSDDPLGKRAVVYTVERLAACFSDAELVQNPEDLETLARLRVPARRLHLLGNGVDLGRFGGGDGGAVAGGSGRGEGDRVRDRVRAEVGAGPETVVVLAVGRLVREKGYVELFAAARELRQRRAGVKVVVAGPEEPSKSDGLSPADLALAREAGVVLLGYRPDVEDLYAAADIYVLASHREGFPRSAMEAAAMGLPIVATDIRGCRQVVDDGQTGILFPAGDAGALASAIERLATDAPLRTAMAARAVVKAADEFDQQRVIDLTLRLYGELLGRAGRGSIR